MQVVQTAGLPPNQGKMNLLISGWTWNSKNALTSTAPAKIQPTQAAVCQLAGAADGSVGAETSVTVELTGSLPRFV